MNEHEIERVAAAVMYEGYPLYPYRLAVKNVRRRTFGTVQPRGSGSDQMHSEVLVEGERSVVTAKIRFLQVQERTVGEGTAAPEEFPRVAALDVRGMCHVPCREGIERDLCLEPFPLQKLQKRLERREFRFRGERRRELLWDADGKVVGDLVRERQDILGHAELRAQALREGLFRLTLRLVNATESPDPSELGSAEGRSLMAAHAILRVRGGRFLSLSDPPAADAEHARSCRNTGCWPVLIGDPAAAGTLLCSPILLPDYPRLAEESPGDLFDGTEIDGILSFRMQTPKESEKREMPSIDPRARAILEQTETLGRRQWESLHGAWRPAPELRDAP
jgi:hydrogenase maturation protease